MVCAADGQEALARVDNGSIDLALLDVVMPRRTGFEVCQAMKSKPETRLIPVVLVTSLNSDADRIETSFEVISERRAHACVDQLIHQGRARLR